MTNDGLAPDEFASAQSKLEAVTRISALTRSGPESLGPGSKERKSTLVNLARGLHLLVDQNLTKPEYCATLARQLDVEWTTACWSSGHTITLMGLNRLLEGAEAYARRLGFDWRGQVFALERLDPQQRFRPATGKLEAVQRIAALTDSPSESLGPGSKERKSVLINLAAGLNVSVDPRMTKPQLGGAIAHALGVPWDPICWSTASTVTLEGLNRLLFAAERALGAWGRGWVDSPQVEARLLLEVLADVVNGPWDGRSCVRQMRQAECRNWAQDEWAGFYFEFIGLPALINAFGGGPVRIANTLFDYRGIRTWDLKAHAVGKHSRPAILNDSRAVETAVDSDGVGFLILSGTVKAEPGFREWQRKYRTDHGRVARPRSAPASYVRRSKSAFHPENLDAIWLGDRHSLEAAQSARLLRTMNQGRQVTGKVRNSKLLLDVSGARLSWLAVARRDLRVRGAAPEPSQTGQDPLL